MVAEEKVRSKKKVAACIALGLGLLVSGCVASASTVVSFSDGSQCATSGSCGPNPGTSPSTSLTFNNIMSGPSGNVNLLVTVRNDEPLAFFSSPNQPSDNAQNFVFYGTDRTNDKVGGILNDSSECVTTVNMVTTYHCTGIGSASSNKAGEPSIAHEGQDKFDGVIFDFTTGTARPLANTFKLILVGYTSTGGDIVNIFLNGIEHDGVTVTGSGAGAYIDFSQFVLAPNTSINNLVIMAGGLATQSSYPNAFLIGGWDADIATPEPATYSLMGVGLAGLIALRLRRRKSAN